MTPNTQKPAPINSLVLIAVQDTNEPIGKQAKYIAATDLAANASGGTVTTVGEFRASSNLATNRVVTTIDFGGGTWYYLGIKGDDDPTIDDTGTTIITADNHIWKRIFYDRIDVTWFGAVRGKTVNNAPAINAAINYAFSLLGGTVFIPAGDWGIGSSIIMKKGVRLAGASMYSTMLYPLSNGLSVIKGRGVRHTQIESLQIISEEKTGVVAIDYRGEVFTADGNFENITGRFEDILVTGCEYSVRSAFSYYFTLTNVQSKDTRYGMELGNASNSWVFNGGSLFCIEKGMTIINSTAVTFLGTTFEYRSWVELFNTDGVSFGGGVYFENTEEGSPLTYWILIGTGAVSARGTVITACNFNVGAPYCVWIRNAEGLVITGNTLNPGMKAAVFDKDGDAIKNGIVIAGNKYGKNSNSTHNLANAFTVVGESTNPLAGNFTQDVLQPFRFYTSPTEPENGLVSENISIVYAFGNDLYYKHMKDGVVKRRSLPGIDGNGSPNIFPIYDTIDTIKASQVSDDGASVTILDRFLKIKDDDDAQTNLLISRDHIQAGNTTDFLPLRINPGGGKVLVGTSTISGVASRMQVDGAIEAYDGTAPTHVATVGQLAEKKAAASLDTSVVAVGATPTKAEFDALLVELRDLKTKMRTANLLA